MIKRLAPEKHHKNLIPTYREHACTLSFYALLIILLAMGCKRIVIDPDYLVSLQRSNIDLEWDPITEITESGITTKSGIVQSINHCELRS